MTFCFVWRNATGVALPAGLSGVQVAVAIAVAINANSQLRQLGVAATMNGMTVATNGDVVSFSNSNPGLVIDSAPGVPRLSPLALVMLAGALGAAGIRSTRRRARGRGRGRGR